MKYILTVLIAFTVIAFACNSRNESQKLADLKVPEPKEITIVDTKQKEETESGFRGYDADSTGKQQNPGQQNNKKQPVAQQAVTPDWDKKIIKTANVNLEVKDYNIFYTSLREKVKNMGGYVAQEEQTQSDYKIENTMTIKVPVDQFDNAVLQLTSNVEKINERKITSQDVTGEVVDTKSRMEAKKQVRQRYMDLLGQAKKMEDILSVQSEINSIQEEIESASGRIEYLSHSSAYSSINLTYYQVLNSSAKDTEAAKASFGQKVKDAFHTGWELVSNLFVGIITIWPLLLASFFAFFLYKKLRAQKPKQA
jgi:predicted  nucleic acid-binding Zn-ribbon protein